MVVSGGKGLKRAAKKRVTADFYDFLTFPTPALAESENFAGGPFRSNVRAFLTKHALLPPPSALFPHLLTWQIVFRVGELTEGPDAPAVCLDVVEEDVARSRSVYCDQCRVFGELTRQYFSRLERPSSVRETLPFYNQSRWELHWWVPQAVYVLWRHLAFVRIQVSNFVLPKQQCKSCNHVTTTDDVEDWVYHQLENTTHLLHGVVHANGYGHLLRVNGREGGSRFLSGIHIMDFWDRLCKTLGVRKVSVMDVSKKYGIEYRMLHAIMKGHPWYGDWGYKFGSGSYCLTHEAYKSAVESLSNLPLSSFSHGRMPNSRVEDMIKYYQSLSEHELVNIRDLFCFIMGLIGDAHKTASNVDETTCKKRCFNASGLSMSWDKSGIERVEQAMIRVLRAVSESKWVSWRALRGAASKLGSPELLDYCLGELGGKMVYGGMVVNSQCNPQSGVYEFRLEAATGACYGILAKNNSLGSKYPSEENLLQCLRYLYDSLLHPQMMVNYEAGTRTLAMNSAQKLFDCKQFVKDYNPEMWPLSDSQMFRLSCHVELVDEFEDSEAITPPELVVLPLNATVAELKNQAANAFQDVYLRFRRLQVDGLHGYSGVDDSTQVKLLLGSRDVVCVRGRCIGKNGLSKFRMERGLERWTVDCSCGAKDDDGERMLACDICGVWRHTRCSDIHDTDPVPARFVCLKCQNCESKLKCSGHCKDETVTNVSGSSCFRNGLPVPSDVI
ncbi:hypothetical protein JHK87_057181 [Glycine soja]|nr:hypothetical protein JHK87_057181 [Glycine soja]